MEFCGEKAFILQKHFEAWHEEIALRILTNLLKRIGGYEKPIRYEKLYALYNSMQNYEGLPRTLAGCFIVFDALKKHFIISKE